MKDFKLIKCDNPTSAGMNFVGRTARFSYDGTRFYFSSLYSSQVVTIANTIGMMQVQTRNTLYTFEAIAPKPLDLDDEAVLRAFIV